MSERSERLHFERASAHTSAYFRRYDHTASSRREYDESAGDAVTGAYARNTRKTRLSELRGLAAPSSSSALRTGSAVTGAYDSAALIATRSRSNAAADDAATAPSRGVAAERATRDTRRRTTINDIADRTLGDRERRQEMKNRCLSMHRNSLHCNAIDAIVDSRVLRCCAEVLSRIRPKSRQILASCGKP